MEELAAPGVYKVLHEATARFCAEAQGVLDRAGIPAIAATVASLWQFLFMGEPPAPTRT